MKSIIKRFISQCQYLLIALFDLIFKFQQQSKVTFIIGVDEIANCTYFLKNVFGEKAVSVNFHANQYYKNNQYDYSLPDFGRFSSRLRYLYGPYLLAKLANKGDVFIYLWSTGFCIDREIDYKYLKRKQKKIICIFLGSDIRSLTLQREYGERYRIDTMATYLTLPDNEAAVKQVAKNADKYADLIFNHPKDQISYLKSKQIVYPYMIPDHYLKCDTTKFETLDKIIIVHAPSNPMIKGTQLVRAAIKKLEVDGYDFEYIEMINMPNTEVLKTLERSHIVLNEFYAFVLGVFSIEGMAKYNAVLTSAEFSDVSDKAQSAWLTTKYWEIYDNLKYLLDNPEKIEYFATRGYSFVKNNYTEKKVRQFYTDIFLHHGIISDQNTL